MSAAVASSPESASPALAAAELVPLPLDKRMTIDDVVSELSSGMTLGIGGWGSRRKPLALVDAIAASDLTDLTIVSYGGADVGKLCAAGKVKKLVFGFVSLDSIPLEPNFRKARQQGAIDVLELDEGMLWLGLQAAAWRIPFLPTRAGMASGVTDNAPELRTVKSPYDDGEELLAMPALPLDAAIVHVNDADQAGNCAILGPDPFFDDLFCMAAKRAYATAERIVATEDLGAVTLPRLMVSGVVEAPGGAGFTSCPPDYERDEDAQRAYVKQVKASKQHVI